MPSTDNPPETIDAANKNPWTEETKTKFETKSKSKYMDPCQDAAKRSIKCLNRNNGDREMCGEYFQAWRDCRQAWMDQRKEERRKAGSFF
ncbi:Cytochrome c oxidase-assembly factor cox-23 like protein [Verticillium longisporum]|uniref:Cytochrome c oxidase-assembly factor cox-23 like protein n=1 Tax=Verticillium longisporum TaxID=100787 RepID=A0A8I3APX3_VERLO|nr:Cytochrome c oxidase-assembly factor cox-23 like protein [Verticillium longisporum]KAG7131607.1 Cytochrome c oxidase-assembly factor cox-23 like protein [Verticillium longisporum]